MTRWRTILAAIAAFLGLTLAAVVVAIVAAALFGVTIDLSRWRETAAARATAALGRPVILQSPVELTLGREAALSLGGVRVLNPPGFTTTEFAVLGAARARFDLFDAVRGRLHVRSVEGRDVHLQLERTSDGRANWVFAAARSADDSAQRTAIEVDEITLKRLMIEYHDARVASQHVFVLDELTASGRWNESLRLALRGHAGNESPYTLTVEGGPMRSLHEATAPWPFSLDFAFLDTRLHASGAVDVGKGESRFHFRGGAEDLAQVERFLDRKLPRFGAF